MSIRRRLSQEEATMLGLKVKPHEKDRFTNRYNISQEQNDQINELRGISPERKFVETQKKLGKDGQVVSTIEKLQSEPIDIPDNFEIIKISTSKTTGQQWIQYSPKKELKEDDIADLFDFESILNGRVKHLNVIPNTINESLFDRLIYTDTHIGMEVNPDGYSLYGGVWNEEEANKRLETMVKLTIENRKSKVLYIDDLGDFMDGWNGQTARGGHDLPQNMDNQKAFDEGLKFKIAMIDELIKYYDEIYCNNICEDNHAGSYAYIVNSAFKTFIEMRYNNVKVNNIRKFIDYYSVGNYRIVLSHGKDSKNLKFGFKAMLDKPQENKIDNYLRENDIVGKNLRIEFSKGDSHQFVYDKTTSIAFDYFSYPAFSPASSWVQTNFSKSKSGFVFRNYYEDRDVMHTYEFK